LNSTDTDPRLARAHQERLSSGAKWAVLAAFTLTILVLLALAMEMAIRFRQTLKYGSADTVETLYRVDPRIGLRVPIANLHSGHILTNSLGFRGPELSIPKSPGTVRVAFLGASTTWCGEVSSNEVVWPELVTKQLRRSHPDSAIDYVNAGVPGYTIESSIKNFQYRVAPLEADIVIIYHATNDLSGELRALAVAKGVIADARVQQPSWLSAHSLLWNLAEKNFRVWVAQKKAEAKVGRLEVDAANLGENFRRELTALIGAARKQARLVAVATFSTQLRTGQTADQQLRASASALYYMPFMTPDGLLKSYRRYNEIIREVARATGALLIDGEDEIPGDPQHFVDTVHFTDAGSQAMAVRVSRALSHSREIEALLTRSP
jgi:lysophospholipase L1-like esterase